MKILKVIDQYGWAYDFLSREQQKYTRHKIDIIRLADLRTVQFDKYDIVYFSSPDLSKEVNKWTAYLNQIFPHIVIIGGVAGETACTYTNVDLVVVISAKFYPKMKQLYKNTPVIFMPEGIDTNFFVPAKDINDEFIVGWVGRPCAVKRTHLLENLNYLIKKQQDWGHSYFKKGRTQDHMLEYYHSITCLVLTSSSECMPRVVLEAMSCQLPVVSTDVGSLRMVIDSKWLTDVNPEHLVVSQMNSRLSELEHNKLTRVNLGVRNRGHVVRHFSWERLQPIWDNIFEVAFTDTNEVVAIGDVLREQYKKDEPALI